MRVCVSVCVCMRVCVNMFYLCILLCSEYENPEPSKKVIQDNVDNFMHTVNKLGSDRHNTIRCPFRHDVCRYLFRDKTELNFDDFDSTYFKPG